MLCARFDEYILVYILRGRARIKQFIYNMYIRWVSMTMTMMMMRNRAYIDKLHMKIHTKGGPSARYVVRTKQGAPL